VGLSFWIASLVCLMAMTVTLSHSERLTLGMLFGFRLLMGLSTAPTTSAEGAVDG
jgi:FtsH-binding integral membrane protein